MNLRLISIFFVFGLFSVMSFAREMSVSNHSIDPKGGVRISLKFLEDEKIGYAGVGILVENKTAKRVCYNSLLVAGGFEFYLFDSKGELIHPNPLMVEERRKLDERAKETKFVSRGDEFYEIGAYGVVEIMGVNLNKYYDQRWKDASIIHCVWDPGLDFGDKPNLLSEKYNVGDGLTGTLDMSPITGKSLSPGIEIRLPEEAKVLRTKIDYDKIHPEVPSAPTFSEALAVVGGTELKKDENKASVLRDGIEVSARWGRMVETTIPAVVCEANDHTGGQVNYIRKAPGIGYALRLFTPEGEAIEATHVWKVRHYPSDRFQRMLQSMVLPSERGDELRLELEDAFGPDWKNAALLAVNWYQDEPTSGKRPPVTVVLDLSGLTGKTISLDALKKKVEAADRRLLDTPSRRSVSLEDTKGQEARNSVRAGWWIGGALVVLIAWVVFLKKRTQSSRS